MDDFMLHKGAAELTLDGLIAYAAGQSASDIFIKAGAPPGLRVLGSIVKTPFPFLTSKDPERLAFEHFDARQRERFARHWR